MSSTIAVRVVPQGNRNLVVSFFSELKQRRIVQIVASYLVSGWVALEVIGALVERGVLPEIAYGLALVAYLGGLGATAILGWYHGEKGRQNYTAFEVGLLVVVGGATLFGGYRTWGNYQLEQAATQVAMRNAENLRRVAVLYFADGSRNRDLGYLADGLTESLLERLGDAQGLDLVSQSGSALYRDSDLPRDSIARALGAGILIDGVVEPNGDDVRVSLSLIDGDGGAELYRARVEASADDPFRLQDELAGQVLDQLRAWLGNELTVRSARRGTENVAAWANYQRALRARREADSRINAGDVQGFIDEWTRADELLVVAQEADPAWTRPRVVRALLASRWGELSAGESRIEANEYFDLALSRVDEVIRAEPRDAFARQARGTIQYFRWALGLVDGEGPAAEVLDDAEVELDQATRSDPSLAHSWNLLSIVRSEKSDLVGANQAARRALETDEFLRSAESVLTTLWATSYDLEDLRKARDYCEQGRSEYPDNPVFRQCALWLMAAGAIDPDLDRAWAAVDEYLERLPESSRAREAVASRLLVAQVAAELANLTTGPGGEAMADSARAIIAGAQASPTIDPTRELLGLEALAHLKLGDEETAVRRVGVYLTASPTHREGWRWTSHWWWRPLQDNPDFRRLIGR